ncbi:MAG: AAA family ATPase [Stenotrophomonas chelatiphaga]
MERPFLFVLAGVNGAGKSSIGGHLLRENGLDWFNPDTWARHLREQQQIDPRQANADAWQEGFARLNAAIAGKRSHAFETTLGGRSIATTLAEASATHDVLVWYCGLASPEQHIARVAARVQAGGHPISEADIRRRYPLALQNLIDLMPRLAQLQVYDNSTDVAHGEAVPDPQLVLQMDAGTLTWPAPDDADSLRHTPRWAIPVLEAALQCSEMQASTPHR